jgi:uncharacterized membrane protein
MNKSILLAGAAVTGAVGYGLGVGLARVTTYAERLEEDQYCRPRVVRPPQQREATGAT